MKYLNEVICGDCISLLDNLEDDSIDAVVIDPPYGTGTSQGYAGDDSADEARDLLQKFLESLKSKLKQNGHIAIFWTMRNLDVCIEIAKSFYTFRRVLSMYIPRGNARNYLGWLPRTQAIVVAQKYVPGQPTDFHWELSTYLNEKMKAAGYNRSQLAKEIGCDSRLVMKWTRNYDPAFCLPTPRFYPKLKALLKLDNRYDFLLTRQPSHRENRKDFEYKHDTYIVGKEREGEMLHSAQKPLSVIEHLVTCVCPKGGVVLDGFAGSGTTAVAAQKTGRNFICFEISSEYCEIARKRLTNV